LDILANPLFWISLLVAIGLCAGTITGIMGGSGVVVVVPALMFFAGFPVHVAIGTSLFVDVVASLVASYTYAQNKNLDMSQGVWMAIAAVGGAQLGSLIAASTPSFGLTWDFGIFLIINGAYILKTGMHKITTRISRIRNRRPSNGNKDTAKGRGVTIASILLGLGIGIVSGFIGAGGGMMFLLVLLFVLGYELHVAIGTSTLIMAITAASGSAGYYLHGNLELVAALVISVGTVVSVRLSAVVANRLGEEALGRIIAVIFIVLGVMMLLSVIA
jgi:uncharacterized membrane protein YfcA